MNTTRKRCPDCTFYHEEDIDCIRKILELSKQIKIDNKVPKSTTKITWRCPDCKGHHTTTEDRKYYCTLLASW
jgi:hypothetical protein